MTEIQAPRQAETPIRQVFPFPIRRALSGIETVGDLIRFTPQRLQSLDRMSWKMVSQVQQVIEKHGFRLSGSDS